jgi:hypothetical protein
MVHIAATFHVVILFSNFCTSGPASFEQQQRSHIECQANSGPPEQSQRNTLHYFTKGNGNHRKNQVHFSNRITQNILTVLENISQVEGNLYNRYWWLSG